MEESSRQRQAPGLGRNYWKLWSASAISNLGDGTSQIAYPWLASILTRDPLLVAGLAVALRLPWLLFSLPAGVIVDRGDRRRLMVGMNVARAVLSFGLAVAIVAGGASIWLLYLVALLVGFAEVVYDNAAQTIVPRLVPTERLERANGNLLGAEAVTNHFAGPPLGGLLIAVGLSVPFFVDAATFAVAASLVFVISGSYRAQGRPEAPAAARRSMLADVAEGCRWLWRHELLRTLALALGAMNLLMSMTTATFVLFVQEVLGLNAAQFGLLVTTGAAGGLLGSVLGPNVAKRIGSGPSLYSCLLGGIVSSAVIGLTSTAIVVGAMFVIASFTGVVWNVVTVALRQTIIPDHLLGRVNSVYRFLGWGGLPIGALLGGALVTVAEPLFGRDPALRAPFLASAVLYLVLLVIVGGKLRTRHVEAARAGPVDKLK
jgi:MFS family permease